MKSHDRFLIILLVCLFTGRGPSVTTTWTSSNLFVWGTSPSPNPAPPTHHRLSVLVPYMFKFVHLDLIIAREPPPLDQLESGQLAFDWKTFLLPAAMKLGQGNVFTGVCHSVHRGEGVCLSACWDTTTPRSRHPPWDQTPPGSRPPKQTQPPLDQTPPHLGAELPLGADVPLQEQTPPRADTPPWEQTTPQGRPPGNQTPPGSRRQHTVNERPVRILLECILVLG